MLAGGVLIASWSGTRTVIEWLTRKNVLDHPNERSSHSEPTPRGGGLAILAAVLPALIVVHFSIPGQNNSIITLVVLTAVLGLVSWVDDTRNLKPAVRLVAQISTVLLAILFSSINPIPALQFLPSVLQIAIIVLGWVWFINLFNFMDGIDGLAAVETISISAGAVLIGTFQGEPDAALILPGLILMAASLGFFIWNWAPAKIFLGDVGSVTLGFLLGWLLLIMAAKGFLAAAIILPLYFIVDATWTLFARIIRREKIWVAHSQHFYQRAVKRGLSHGRVTFAVFVLNALLIALAIASIKQPLPAFFLALFFVAGFIVYLKKVSLIKGRPLFRKPPIDRDPSP